MQVLGPTNPTLKSMARVPDNVPTLGLAPIIDARWLWFETNERVWWRLRVSLALTTYYVCSTETCTTYVCPIRKDHRQGAFPMRLFVAANWEYNPPWSTSSECLLPPHASSISRHGRPLGVLQGNTEATFSNRRQAP